MATFFGEVQFASTRAYDEDCDEAIIERYETEICLQTERKLDCVSIIASFGALANEFLEGCTQECQSIGVLKLKRRTETEGIDTCDSHPRELKPCPLFLTTKNVLLFISSGDVVPKLATKVAKKLLSLSATSSPVLVLSSWHLSQLNSEVEAGDLHSTFLVHSDSFKSGLQGFPLLPQPSVLYSFPAAVLTECIVEDKPCGVYAAFTETSSPENVDLVAADFVKAISHPLFDNLIEYDRKYSSSSKKSYMMDRYM